jgi:hypothetical protein
VLAFTQLIQSRLEPATHYTTWLEKRGFQVYRQVGHTSTRNWCAPQPATACNNCM